MDWALDDPPAIDPGDASEYRRVRDEASRSSARSWIARIKDPPWEERDAARRARGAGGGQHGVRAAAPEDGGAPGGAEPADARAAHAVPSARRLVASTMPFGLRACALRFKHRRPTI